MRYSIKMENIFTNIYEKKIWGNNKSPNYKGSSGDGSTTDYNKTTYVPFLKKFITDNSIKSVVDLGCGDFLCGDLIYDDLDIKYTGYDVYKKVITYHKKHYSLPKYNFMHLDFYNKKEDIVGGDMCILKDVIQHWSTSCIYNFLDYLISSKKFKYILICNCCNQTCNNTDIKVGQWRQLNSKFLPLSKYNPEVVYKYNTKEVCLIND